MESGIANRVLAQMLHSIRTATSKLSLDPDRLPGWHSAAKVRTGWVHDALIAVFEDAIDEDFYRTLGAVHSDTVVLLDMRDFVPQGASLDANGGLEGDIARARSVGLVLLHGAMPDPSIISLNSKNGSFFNVGYCGYFPPKGLLNMFLEWRPEGSSYPLALRFIPFALFIHRDDLFHPDQLINRCMQYILGRLKSIQDSEAGDHYSSIKRRLETFGINHENGVIVLGSYADPEIKELLQIRDKLRGMRYDAHLIEDLPETPLMSLPDKVRYWTGGSRFSVMLDRKPSGHLNEYEILKHQETILSLLHRRNSGSTRMIGVESLNYSFIRDFNFDNSPHEVLEDAVAWADGVANERIKTYEEFYPWKRKTRKNRSRS